MKVSDVMSTQVDFVTTDTTVKDISRLIFGRGINGVPVCKGKKVVGFITEEDILSRFHPSMEEFVEDTVHTSDFEAMEKRITDILSLPANKIMSKHPTTVYADTPLLRAHSMLILKRIGRLPVVDKKRNLIGIVSKGDIFRGVVGERLNIEESEEYNDWLSKHYLISIDWKRRLSHEIPDLVKILKKEKIKNILDIGCGIGMHTVALAKEGFNVCAFERSELMIKEAKKRLGKEPDIVKSRIKFYSGEFEDAVLKADKQCEAAIFMGNSISHNPDTCQDIIKLTSKVLSKKAVMIFQIRNYENVFNKRNRLSQFRFSKGEVYQEHAFIEFYDPSRSRKKTTLKTSAIFDFDGRRWKFYGLRNTLFAYITKADIADILKRCGFKKTHFYGSYTGEEIDNWDYLFRKQFKHLDSDWLNIVAKRG